MRALIDAHALLWHIEGSSKLSVKAREVIDSNANSIFFSIASIWEIAIKLGLGKLALENPFSALEELLTELEIEILQISFKDAEQYLTLPLHHRDPFDRMLIAQAITHSLAVVSVDTAFDAYPIQRVWA
ncbi:type II toxin-antitoxin system VapC family toxin [Nodosilinea nodulosa]|uniref:type II toxin-antitoxin system VapC family toxin n=1 Tax=Nodosilinea nodulosa TaxID=416001 RepID=UPI0002E590EA|nr:type II toxin-antitoxin system VapC family toxin [Nodosilinea nodulosa]